MIIINKIKDICYNIKYGIKNLINWFPTIWLDRDYDHCFFHEIMLHKLKNMEQFFRSDYAYSANAIKDADNIKYTINLLERIINNVYTQEALKPFYKKYPDYKFEFKTEPSPNNPNYHRLIDDKTEDQKELLSICYKNADELEKKDLDELYKYLREHIEEWWD